MIVQNPFANPWTIFLKANMCVCVRAQIPTK